MAKGERFGFGKEFFRLPFFLPDGFSVLTSWFYLATASSHKGATGGGYGFYLQLLGVNH
jgi:hypothetical protein